MVPAVRGKVVAVADGGRGAFSMGKLRLYGEHGWENTVGYVLQWVRLMGMGARKHSYEAMGMGIGIGIGYGYGYGDVGATFFDKNFLFNKNTHEACVHFRHLLFSFPFFFFFPD